MGSVVDMSGPVTLNPSDLGTKKKWKLKNNTKEPIHDLYFKTGPKSLFEIEFPWGDTGNPPDVRKVTVKEEGFDDGSKEFDDETEGKLTMDPPIGPGCEFELVFEFDDNFEPKEYIELIPTDAEGVTIEDDTSTTTEEPNTGAKELLEGIGKALGALKSMNVKTPEGMLAFDKKKQVYVLAFEDVKPFKKKAMAVQHVKRKLTKYDAHYGLVETKRKPTRRKRRAKG